MDNKKLMQLLLRDIRGVAELIREMQEQGSYDALDLEMLHTRIKGVVHLLEVAGDYGKAAVTDVIPQGRPVQEPVPAVHEKPVVKEVPEPIVPPAVEVAGVVAREIPPVEIHKAATREEPAQSPTVSNPEETLIFEGTDSGTETDHSQEKQILAEKFIAGKSVHDLLADKTKSDSRFSNIPLAHLTTSIGTNDKFLFSRELFDGNMENFMETLRKLDSMGSLQEAAAYLRDHFRWKKSETSLKFIELVKRRFL